LLITVRDKTITPDLKMKRPRTGVLI